MEIRNNFRMTKKFLIAKFDCISYQLQTVFENRVIEKLKTGKTLIYERMKKVLNRESNHWKPSNDKYCFLKTIFLLSKYVHTIT